MRGKSASDPGLMIIASFPMTADPAKLFPQKVFRRIEKLDSHFADDHRQPPWKANAGVTGEQSRNSHPRGTGGFRTFRLSVERRQREIEIKSNYGSRSRFYGYGLTGD